MMRPDGARAISAWPFRNGSPARSPESLANVVYRSHAAHDMSPAGLHELTEFAQARNRHEAVTGVMLYDSGHFFQWLEGPADGVNRVMASISRDPRHTNIQVLANQSVQARAFADWSMKLATPGPQMATGHGDAIALPPAIVEGLRFRPDAAPSLLVQLGTGAAAPNPAPSQAMPWSDSGRARTLHPRAAAILRDLVHATILPRLVATAAAPQPLRASLRAVELAEALIGNDQSAAIDMVQDLHGSVGSTPRLYATLLEPAARNLGDMWAEDACSEFDLTLGLCRLQTAVRLLSANQPNVVPGRLAKPSVLIVPEPGEAHRLSAAMDSSILHDAGWSPECAFPDNDVALEELLSSAWFDVLDLSLSVALREEQSLPRLAETIVLARRASRNPALLVVVGGRVFHEARAAGLRVGADAASPSSGNVDRLILRTFNETLQVTATAS